MRLINSYITLFSLILLASYSYSQNINLRINTKVDDAEILKLLPKKTAYKTVLNIEKELRKSLSIYYDNGYLAASFDSSKADSASYTTNFVLGSQIKWANLQKGNIDEEYISQSGYREKLYNNKVFYYRQTAKLLQKLLPFYTNNGYPFAKIKLDSIHFMGAKITANLKVEKGQAYQIDSIQIIGNAKISKKYLYNLLNIKPKDAFNDEAFTSIDKKLKQIPFLTVTKPSEVNFYESSATIVVNIDAKKTNQIDGIIGFLPNTSTTGELLITGQVKLKLMNAFKRGSLIDVNWNKLQVATQDLKTQINYPFILGSSFGVDAQLYLFKQDTSFVNTNTKLALQYLLQGNSYFQGFVNKKKSNVLNSSNPNFANTSYLGYGVGYKTTDVDYVLNPTKGFDFIANTSIGDKEVEQNFISKTSTQINWDTKVNYYLPILNKTSVLKLAINAAHIYNKDTLIQNELHRIGGLKTLRGFNEAVIFADFYSIATLEFRYLLDQHSYLSLFYDAAYFEEKAFKNYANGFGAGISFETKTGIFSLSYALGKQAGNDLLFKNGKIHFGIASYF